ncbi:SpaA isopeptide-forming pilin-related protein [Corynebacterium pseudodiphtheriticum]|uniref:SpaA isopeptide-forming pilin-related protein n=1 Tax=Corynebacterium pseudodiphtheriticum TaxID=37637 RepID=UPI00155AB14B|nr:SpaA isopeptide-forming pilin-related protein [Corynebacterium pseudodiphtheriticum]MDK4250702.1 SpaA isopeptide-forming pilin-related protein [Corynebacterium pseudodiphtheriticum]
MVLLSPPRLAADERVITGNDQNLSADEMEAKREQTLNIKKLPRNPHDDPIPGQKPYGGVEGLKFRLSKVQGVDVTTNDGRESAKNYTVQRARHEGFSEIREAKTNADGVAVFEQLGPGLYLIEEFAPDEEYDWRLSRPQLVILPLGDVMGESYSYDNVLVTKPEPTITPGTPGDPGTPGTPPSTPQEPGEPGEPGRPDDPEAPGNPGGGEKTRGGGDGELAITGANVLWAFLAGVGLIVFGFVLMRKKN